jgi:hypothetical protein
MVRLLRLPWGLLGMMLLPVATPASQPAAPLPKDEPSDILVFANIGETAKTLPPTAEKPAYYLMMVGGYHREGLATGGENSEKITAEQVWPPLQKALAAQHYLPATKGTPPPTLLIVFHWGVMTPDILPAMSDTTTDTFANGEKMSQLTGGTRVARRFDFDLDYEEARGRATEERFMVIVSAYDLAAANSAKHEKKVIWRARMSAPSAHTTLAASIVPLIASGAPFFGREMTRAEEVPWDRTKVEIGEAKVVGRVGDTK